MERLWCGQRHPPVCVIESPAIVMPALVAGIHVFLTKLQQVGVDGRDKPGHDSEEVAQHERNPL
jgi:hypothetical protein